MAKYPNLKNVYSLMTKFDDSLEVLGYHDRAEKERIMDYLYKESNYDLYTNDTEEEIWTAIEGLSDTIKSQAEYASKIRNLIDTSGLPKSSCEHVRDNFEKAIKLDCPYVVVAYLCGEIIGVMAHTPTKDKSSASQKKARQDGIGAIYDYMELVLPVSVFDELFMDKKEAPYKVEDTNTTVSEEE